MQAARVGLVNAVNRFDVDNGADFLSFAVPTMMGEVRRHFRDYAWVKVPRRLKDAQSQLNQARSVLSQRLVARRPPLNSQLISASTENQSSKQRSPVAANPPFLLMFRPAQTMNTDCSVTPQAAERVLAEDAGASMEQIAEAAGLTRITVHRRFANRHALLEALSVSAMQQLLEAIEEARPNSAPAIVALYRVTANVLRVKSAFRFTLNHNTSLSEAAAKRQPPSGRTSTPTPSNCWPAHSARDSSPRPPTCNGRGRCTTPL